MTAASRRRHQKAGSRGRLDRARDTTADAVVGAADDRVGILGVEGLVDFPAACS
jgi:hypothetical protein